MLVVKDLRLEVGQRTWPTKAGMGKETEKFKEMEREMSSCKDKRRKKNTTTEKIDKSVKEIKKGNWECIFK